MRYLNVKKITIKVLFRRFRPLAGSKVSERQQEMHITPKAECFRPLSGTKVSEQFFEASFDLSEPIGFRPLAGIKVSELHHTRALQNLLSFRPLSGIKVSEPN